MSKKRESLQKVIPRRKLVNFGTMVVDHNGRRMSKICKCNSFKYFLKFSTLRSNFWKKCKQAVFEICGVIDQVDHEESECEVKTGTGSSFLGFSRANFSVAIGRPILVAVCYVWGLNI